VPEFSPFMLDVLEVVDSLAESPKCVTTQNEHEPEAPARNCENRTVQFSKLDGLVLLGLTMVRGTVRLQCGTSFSTKW
jgi:hypothetical protein